MSRKSIKGLNFDINDEPELSDYNELTFDELIGNRIKTEKNILYKIAMMTAINDISKANINEKKISTGDDKIKFLNDMFIDNVVFSAISQASNEKDDIGYYNSVLRKHFKSLFGDTTFKIMCIRENTDKEILTNSNINNYKKAMNTTLKNDKDYYKVIDYKITLNEIDMNKALLFLNDNMDCLNSKCLYLHDIDYTIDMGFGFDTNNLKNELEKRFDFHYEGDKNRRFIQKDYDNNVEFWVVDEDENIDIRVKIYNKYIQMMESPSVRENYGSHICKWINSKNKTFDKAIEKSLNYGYSRLEMTFYTTEGRPPKYDVVEQNFNEIYYIINNVSNVSSNSIFYNPIKNQFTAIMECINETLIIYDNAKKQLLMVRWFNGLSYKMNGILFKNVSCLSNRMIYILGKMTFNNIPIRIIMIDYETDKKTKEDDDDNDDDNDDNDEELFIIDNEEKIDKIDRKKKIKINVRTYLRNGYDKTILTDKKDDYKITKNQNQPNNRGIEYDKFNFKISTENDGTKKENKDIFFKQVITNKKIEYLKQNQLKKKSLSKLKDVENVNNQIERYLKNLEDKNDEFKLYQEKRLNLLNKLNEIDNNYHIKNVKSFKDFVINDDFFISCFIKRNEKNILIYDELRKQWIYSNDIVINFINDVYVNHYNQLKYVEYDERKIYYYTNSNDNCDLIAKMKYDKMYKDKQKNKKYEISIINNITKESYKDDEETIENEPVEDKKIYEIQGEINRKYTTDFNKLELNEIYEIQGITKRPFRNTNHYYLHLLYKNKLIQQGDDPKIFIANYWLRQILNEIDYIKMIDEKPIKFKILKARTTWNKTIENTIDINENIVNQYKLQ